MSSRRGVPAFAIAVVAGAVLVASLLAASTSGPVRVFSDPPPAAPVTTEDIVLVPDEPGAELDDTGGQVPEPEENRDWFMRVVAVVVGILLLRLAWMVAVGWWAILRSWRFEREQSTTPSFDPLPSGRGQAHVILDEDAQKAALRTGTPRNAIVACWVRLEDDVAAAGIVPVPSETSSELTMRVLDAALADRAAVTELAERYREARFSGHPIGESERALALDALTRIHASLRLTSLPLASAPPAAAEQVDGVGAR